jgi:N-acetyl sugar amidotransferase
MEKNYSLYGLPEEAQYCKKCVVSNQRPNSTVEFKSSSKTKNGIYFDEAGICDACNYNTYKNEINWKKREEMLFEILKKYRKNNGEYDCIVPSSGGKDSSFTAHILKYKYKMNPLSVTWAPNMWTDVGWSNFQNLSKIGGIDNFLYTPNGKLHRYLTKQAFLKLGHPFQPFMHGQKVIGPKIASQMNISLVIYGENQAEYGNKMSDNQDYEMKNDFFSIENDFDLNSLKIAGMKIEEHIKNTDFDLKEFAPYFPIKNSEIKEKKIKMVYLGFFEKWDPQECYYYACKNTGFKAADSRSEGTYSKYTEIDDKIVPFHFFTTFIKFGIGRATHDASQEIRNNKINREEGISLVKRYDSEFPKRYFDDFLEYIDIDENDFWKTIDALRSPHLWFYDDEKKIWKLRKEIV